MFQSLIQRWLAAQVQGAVQEAVQEAVLRELRGEETPTAGCAEMVPSDTPATEKCAIGMVFAVPMEAAGVVDRLEDARTTKGNGLRYHTGRFGKYRVAVVESGMGQEKAAIATARLIDIFKPERLLSAGYAGGLTESMSHERLLIPSRLVRASDGATMELPGCAPDEEPVVLLTADRVVRTPSEKRELASRFGADLVDMETYAVAECAHGKGIPFLALRIVLDAVEDEIAEEVQRIAGAGSKARMFGSVFGALLKRPSSLLDLYQLKERALTATDKLAKGIERLLK